MPETILILPETNQTTLCVQLTDTVTAEDFTEFFGNPVYERVEKNGWYNLFVYYDRNFKGWSREAADLSFKCISQCSPKARRLAYVNAPDSRMLMMKMLSPLIKAEIRYFEDGEKEEALRWVLSYKHED